MPTCIMALFPIPAGVIKRVEKGFHLVKWKVVITGKKAGGMGIKNLKVQSKALVMKWLWKFVNDNQMLWKRVKSVKT